MYQKISRGLLLLVIHVCFVGVKSDPTAALDAEDSINSIRQLIQMKQFPENRPYQKFALTYQKFDSCGLRYLQKISVCEALFSSDKYKFNIIPLHMNYPDLSCKPVEMDVSNIPDITDNNPLFLSMYECPNPYQIEAAYSEQVVMENQEPKVILKKDAKVFFIPVHVFITGGLLPNSVIFGYKHASPRKLAVKFHTVLFEYPVDKLKEIDVQRRAEKFEPTAIREFTPRRVKRLDLIVKPVHRSADEAEGKVDISYQLKSRSVYNKFKANYDKINICPMTREEKLDLCRQVFENDAYKLFVPEIKDAAKLACSRRKVAILHSRSQLQSAEVALMRCPLKGTNNLYYLAAIHHVWNLVAFVRIPPFVEILPDACLTEINAVNLKSLPHFLKDDLMERALRLTLRKFTVEEPNLV